MEQHQRHTFGLIRVRYRVEMVDDYWMQHHRMDVARGHYLGLLEQHLLWNFHQSSVSKTTWADVSIVSILYVMAAQLDYPLTKVVPFLYAIHSYLGLV